MIREKKENIGCMNLFCETPEKPLHFHHVQKHLKLFCVSKVHYSVYDTIQELRKCIILCSTCHAAIHRKYNRPPLKIGKFQEYFHLLIKDNYPKYVPKKRIFLNLGRQSKYELEKRGKIKEHHLKMVAFNGSRRLCLYDLITYRYPYFYGDMIYGLRYDNITIKFLKYHVSIQKRGFNCVDYSYQYHKPIIRSLDMMIHQNLRRPLKKSKQYPNRLFLPDQLENGILIP